MRQNYVWHRTELSKFILQIMTLVSSANIRGLWYGICKHYERPQNWLHISMYPGQRQNDEFDKVNVFQRSAFC